MNRTNFCPFLIFSMNTFFSFSKSIFDSVGSKIVPIAIAKMPIGNCINLSETYNQVGLPVSSNEAKIVSINKLICITPPAKIAGNINLKNFLSPGFFISNFGFMLFREVPPASFLKKTPIREYLDIN